MHVGQELQSFVVVRNTHVRAEASCLKAKARKMEGPVLLLFHLETHIRNEINNIEWTIKSSLMGRKKNEVDG